MILRQYSIKISRIDLFLTKYLVVREDYLTFKNDYLTVREKYLTVKNKYLTVKNKYLIVKNKYLTFKIFSNGEIFLLFSKRRKALKNGGGEWRWNVLPPLFAYRYVSDS